MVLAIKNVPASERVIRKRYGFNPWAGKILWKRAWQPTSRFLPGESHRQTKPGGLQSMESQSHTQLERLSTQQPRCKEHSSRLLGRGHRMPSVPHQLGGTTRVRVYKRTRQPLGTNDFY